MLGCTIVARNYVPYARVVAAGWQRVHPGAPFSVLLLDGDADDAIDGATVVTPEQLGLARRSLAQLRGIYGVAEINSALKPHLLRHLLDRGAEVVVYLDSDTDVHGSLEDVAELARHSGIALTPNVLRPLAADGLSPSEFDLGRVGMYNSGSIAVGCSGGAFLEWWARRTWRDCLFAEDEGLHGDQRCLDWVPVYFDHRLQDDPTLNVAHWNLHERTVGRSGDTFTVDGSPLRTFHFAGFDPEHPDAVTRYEWEAPLRGLREHNPALVDLCRSYAQRLQSAGYRAARRIPYRYGASVAGTPLAGRERAILRELVLACEARGTEMPDPFDRTRSADFERMLADPAATGLLSVPALERIGHARVGLRHPWRLVLERRRRREIPRPKHADRTREEYRDVQETSADAPTRSLDHSTGGWKIRRRTSHS
jgi:hypothetical protein